MTFDFDIEKNDEVVATLTVEAWFTPVVPGRLDGRPEHCYPSEGGELEFIEVFDGDRQLDEAEVTERFGEKVWTGMETAAMSRRSAR